MDIENFTVHIPTKLIVKKGGVADIVSYVKEDKHEKVLLVYGQGSVKRNGVYDKIITALKSAGIEWCELSDVRPNPEVKKLIEGIEITRKNKVTAILAVGGGSVFDTAKGLALSASLSESDPAEAIWDFYALKRTPTQALKIYGSLTLSATGSEMNGISVISNDAESKKWSIKSTLLFPVVSLIDPEVQTSLPWQQQANGLVDSIMHIIEAISNVPETHKVETTFGIATSLIRTIIKCGHKLQKDPNDYETRANFCLAATFAYNGLCMTAMQGGCNGVHTLQRAMGAIDPKQWHAEGLSVCFPAFVKTSIERGERIELYNKIAQDAFQANGWEDMLEKWNTMVRQWGHPTTLADLFKVKDEAELKNLRQKLFTVCMQKPFSGFFPNNKLPEEFIQRAYELM